MTHQHKNKPQREKNVKDGKNKQNNNFLKLTNLPGDNTNLIKVYQINISGYILSRIILSILNNCQFAGMGILRKFQQYRRLPQDPPPGPPHHLEEELDRLTGKIVRISPPAPELAVTRSPSVVRTASCSRSRVRTRRRPGPTRRSAWCAAPTEPACRPCPAATRSAGGDILIFRGDILIQTLPCSHQVGQQGAQ